MGFWGKLGKGLLKVAPIAASFIPGVGPLAAMGISAAANAASKKISGGSWKSALGAGAIGAGTSLAMGGLKGGNIFAKSGPTSYVNNAVQQTAKRALAPSNGVSWLRKGLDAYKLSRQTGVLGGSRPPQSGGIGPSRRPPYYTPPFNPYGGNGQYYPRY